MLWSCSQTQKVKNIYQKLENNQSSAIQRHVNNDYSWGLSEQLDSTSTIYKYTINEKMSIPQKYHYHQMMYIIIIQGNCIVTIDDHPVITELHKQLYIPKNTSYKITNISNDDKLIYFTFQFD